MKKDVPLVTVEGIDFWDLVSLEDHLMALTTCDNFEEGSSLWWAIRIALRAVSAEIDRR